MLTHTPCLCIERERAHMIMQYVPAWVEANAEEVLLEEHVVTNQVYSYMI